MQVKSQTFSDLRIERVGSVVTVILNNPQVRNRISIESITALRSIMSQIETDTTVRLMVLTGTGRCFCAGFDLNAIAGLVSDIQRDPQLLDSMNDETVPFEKLTNEIEHLRCPTLCVINGHTYGGGVDLALACDFRIGVTGSKIMIPTAKIGLPYPIKATQRLVTRLGLSTSKQLLLGAKCIEGKELVSIGYFNEVVDSDRLPERINELTSIYTEMAPLAVEAMKYSINHFVDSSLPVDRIYELHKACYLSNDLHGWACASQGGNIPKFSRD